MRKPTDDHQGRRRFTAGTIFLCSTLLAPLCGGCQSTTNMSALRKPLDEEAMLGGIAGPTERRLRSAQWERRREQLAAGGVTYEGLEDLDAAQELFDAGEYRAAEKAFRSLAGRREDHGKDWMTRLGEVFSSQSSSEGTLFGQYGDPIPEDALFMAAVSQFAQQKYSWAQDSYAALLEKYPSSRHLDDVNASPVPHRPLLAACIPATEDTMDEIQLVSHEADGEAEVAIDEVSGPAGWPLAPNLIGPDTASGLTPKVGRSRRWR